MEEQGHSVSRDEKERAVILEALRKAATDNGRRPPGERQFRSITGIPGTAWKGKHWIRWSDLIRDAGYAGTGRAAARDDDLLLTRLAEVVRHFGKLPTSREMYFYARRHPGFPSHSTFCVRFVSHRMMFERLRRWAVERPDMADITRLCQEVPEAPSWAAECEPVVYLLRAGEYFKIGWAKTLEKRIRDIQSCYPETLELIHAIPTEDPLATEAQWHHRFRAKRVRGEWFALTPEDVAEFRSEIPQHG